MKRVLFVALLSAALLGCDQPQEGDGVDALLRGLEGWVGAAIPGAGAALYGIRKAVVAQRTVAAMEERPSRAQADVDDLYHRLEKIEGLLMLRGAGALKEDEL